MVLWSSIRSKSTNMRRAERLSVTFKCDCVSRDTLLPLYCENVTIYSATSHPRATTFTSWSSFDHETQCWRRVL